MAKPKKVRNQSGKKEGEVEGKSVQSTLVTLVESTLKPILVGCVVHLFVHIFLVRQYTDYRVIKPTVGNWISVAVWVNVGIFWLFDYWRIRKQTHSHSRTMRLVSMIGVFLQQVWLLIRDYRLKRANFRIAKLQRDRAYQDALGNDYARLLQTVESLQQEAKAQAEVSRLNGEYATQVQKLTAQISELQEQVRSAKESVRKTAIAGRAARDQLRARIADLKIEVREAQNSWRQADSELEELQVRFASAHIGMSDLNSRVALSASEVCMRSQLQRQISVERRRNAALLTDLVDLLLDQVVQERANLKETEASVADLLVLFNRQTLAEDPAVRQIRLDAAYASIPANLL